MWFYIAAIIISYYLQSRSRPKPPSVKPETATIPTVKDGTFVRRIYGTVWINDPVQLAMQQLSPEPIRKKGGKK
jgi:hypothetical protein